MKRKKHVCTVRCARSACYKRQIKRKEARKRAKYPIRHYYRQRLMSSRRSRGA